MITVQNDKKYPMDGVRINWESAIKEIEDSINKHNNKISDLQLLSMIMEIKKLYKIDDTVGYFEFIDNHKEEYKIIRSK